MRCLIVHAHPLEKSLTRHFLETAEATLVAAGHEVELLDLYQIGYDPRLTPQERAGHYAPVHDRSSIEREAAQLEHAEMLVLVFPTWWFSLPAILKGWIDRTFAPGVAFNHRVNSGPITGRLKTLREVVAITTLGSPWWVDRFVMRRPVRRMLKSAVFGTCAPSARFHYLPFASAEQVDAQRVRQFDSRIATLLGKLLTR